MGKLVELALCHGIIGLVLLFVIAPTSIIFLGHLVYIIAGTFGELHKQHNHRP